MNKKQDWRTAEKTKREAPANESERNVAGKKPLHGTIPNDRPQKESASDDRAGQRSDENRNSSGSSRR